MDAKSGLVFSPSHFTWMDTNYPAGTPREGYPVEIQALWFSALDFLGEFSHDKKWKVLADKVRDSICALFLLKDGGYLSDCLHGGPGTPAGKCYCDDSLRPNQLFAITLGAIEDHEIMKKILFNTQELLIPGAIRSLADREVSFQLPVVSAGGKLLNHPSRPYWGKYEGDEDGRRKPAYPNGTAWTWQFPSYSEAYFMAYGESGRKTAKAILSSSVIQLETGCVGNISEITDGDFPHALRGCDAQAWGVTELYRVWKML